MGTAVIIILVIALVGYIFGGSEGAIMAGGTAFMLLLRLAMFGFGVLILWWLFSAIFL